MCPSTIVSFIQGRQKKECISIYFWAGTFYLHHRRNVLGMYLLLCKLPALPCPPLSWLGHAHFVEHLADSGGNGFSTTYVGGYDWSCCLRLHCVDLQPCERKHPLLPLGAPAVCSGRSGKGRPGGAYSHLLWQVG